MNSLSDLSERLIAVDGEVSDAGSALRKIAELAARDDQLSGYSQQQIVDALETRERVVSTALGHGIAIPHCRLEGIDNFTVGLLIAPRGIDFGAPDRKPVHVLLFIIAPEGARNRHIRLLSAASRALGQEEVANSLRAASSAREAHEILERAISHAHAEPADKAGESRCLFQAFVQNETYFEDILEAISSAVDGSIAVVEGTNAGAYLHRMPLFATYWNESQRREIRIVTAFVRRDLVNEIVRRIRSIVDNIEENPGVLIAAQELLYVDGSLEF